MSRLTTALNNDFTALCFLRDELALRASLLEAELKTRWQELEEKLDRLREHIGRAEVAADSTRPQLEAAARTMLDALSKGYRDIKQALKG